MASLTPKRLEKITPILITSLELLKSGGSGSGIESQLSASLNLSYRDVHECMEDLLKHERFAPVAAAVLENGSSSGEPREQYKPALAKLYGCRRYDNSEELSDKRRAWFAVRGITFAN